MTDRLPFPEGSDLAFVRDSAGLVQRDVVSPVYPPFAPALPLRVLLLLRLAERRVRPWLFFFGWRGSEFCTAVTVVSASLRAIAPRHRDGWTLRSARNWRFSAGLKVASYARRARASYRQATSAKTANATGSAKGIIANTYHMSDGPR
jgi:hypothetical protein